MKKKQPLSKHNLIQLLRTLTKYERERLREYLVSPYFRCGRSVLMLFDVLMEFHPSYSAPECTEEEIYRRIYQGRAYNGGTMRDVISSLTSAAENMLYTELAGKSRDKEVTLAQELRMRNLRRLAWKRLGGSAYDTEAEGNEEPGYFLHRYRLEAERYNYDMTYGRQVNKKSIHKLGSEITTSALNLMVHSVTETLSVFVNYLIYTERFDADTAKGFLKNTLRSFPAAKMLAIASADERFGIIAGIYKKLLKAFSTFGNFTAFKAYQADVLTHAARLSRDELSFHIANLIGCAILGGKYGRNKAAFDAELLGLYEATLKNRYYKDSKTTFLPDNLFRAIVVHSLKMNAPKLLLRISKEHIEDLNPAVRNNMRLYASANYNYSAGHRDKALEEISKLEITMFIFKYDVYNLKMRIFADEADHVRAWELINTYRQHIKTDALMPVKRKVFHRNFLDYSSKLLRLMEGSKKIEPGLVLRKLEREEAIIHKEWLMEQFRRYDVPVKRYSQAG